MMEEIESLYRNRAILEQRTAQESSKKVLVDVLCDDLDAFLEYESQITGQYIRSQSQVIGRRKYSFMIPEGRTLLECINQNVRLSKIQIDEIYKQLLEALYEIHKKSCLGRCFHIGNIYYHNNSIKISAFGFYPNLQMMPPELLERKEQSQNRIYSQSIDVWLVGCIIYQLLTGEILNNFRTIKEYRSFYSQIQSQNFDSDWKNRLIEMLHPKEASRCTFFQMHHEIQNRSQENVREFYKNIFVSLNYSFLIKMREQIDENYIEWAVPKEFIKQLELPKVLNPFRCKIQLPSPKQQKQQNVNPYPRIIVNTDYYSQPLQPYPDEPSFYSSNDSLDQNLQSQEQYPDLKFLPYRCRDEQEYFRFKEIWTELHFESYKWFMMNSLKEHLEQYEITNPTEMWAVYCLLKMAILMRQDILNQWETKYLNFDEQKWQSFKTSTQARKFMKDLQFSLYSDKALINDYYQRCQCQILNKEDENLFNEIKTSITKSDVESTSNLFKIPYRKTLRTLYRTIGKIIPQSVDEKLKLAKLQLKTIICMGVSSIFSPLNREDIFRLIKKVSNVNNFDNPNYLELQFQQTDINLLNEQIKIIETEFFKK